MYKRRLNLNFLFYRMTGLQILNIDDSGVKVMLDNGALQTLKQKTIIPNFSLSPSAVILTATLNQANPDFCTFRDIIKRNTLPENERFNIVTHADLNFIETMGNHL